MLMDTTKLTSEEIAFERVLVQKDFEAALRALKHYGATSQDIIDMLAKLLQAERAQLADEASGGKERAE